MDIIFEPNEKESEQCLSVSDTETVVVVDVVDVQQTREFENSPPKIPTPTDSGSGSGRCRVCFGTLDGLIAIIVLLLGVLFPMLACEVLRDRKDQGVWILNDIFPDLVAIFIFTLVPLLLFQKYKETLWTAWSTLNEEEEPYCALERLAQQGDTTTGGKKFDIGRTQWEKKRLLWTICVFRIFLLDLAAAIGLMIGSFCEDFLLPPRRSGEHIWAVQAFSHVAFPIALVWIWTAIRLVNFAYSKDPKTKLRKLVLWFTWSIFLQVAFIFCLQDHIWLVMRYIKHSSGFLIGFVISMWILGIMIRTVAMIIVYKVIQELIAIRRLESQSARSEYSLCESIFRFGLCCW